MNLNPEAGGGGRRERNLEYHGAAWSLNYCLARSSETFLNNKSVNAASGPEQMDTENFNVKLGTTNKMFFWECPTEEQKV